MPSKFTSPYATSFKSGLKSGTPCSTVVNSIAKRTNKPVSVIVKSLWKAGLCFNQKFNGTWVYWPTFPVKASATSINNCQTNLWQNFIDWCILNRWCTPNRLRANATSQSAFMSFCRNFFGKQFATATTTKRRVKKAKRRSTLKSRKSWSSPKTHAARHTKKRRNFKRTRKSSRLRPLYNYKFTSYKSRPATRRYARAA